MVLRPEATAAATGSYHPPRPMTLPVAVSEDNDDCVLVDNELCPSCAYGSAPAPRTFEEEVAIGELSDVRM